MKRIFSNSFLLALTLLVIVFTLNAIVQQIVHDLYVIAVGIDIFVAYFLGYQYSNVLQMRMSFRYAATTGIITVLYPFPIYLALIIILSSFIGSVLAIGLFILIMALASACSLYLGSLSYEQQHTLPPAPVTPPKSSRKTKSKKKK